MIALDHHSAAPRRAIADTCRPYLPEPRQPAARQSRHSCQSRRARSGQRRRPLHLRLGSWAAGLAWVALFCGPGQVLVGLAPHSQLAHARELAADTEPTGTHGRSDAAQTSPGDTVEVSPEATAAQTGTINAPHARTGRWQPPVAPVHVVTPFAVGPHPWSPGHRGVDLTCPQGCALRSPADGVVTFTGVVVDRPVVTVTHADGHRSSFEPAVAVVARGEQVRAGQVVAASSTQHRHLPHADVVHWGVRWHDDYVNPLRGLGLVGPAVLIAAECTLLGPC